MQRQSAMDFEQRLQKAIQRGQRRRDERVREAQAQAGDEGELRRLHSQFRLALSEHIEECMARLPNHFPGFQFETVFGERGWGAACSRDDLQMGPGGRRATQYSRLEITVRPLTEVRILEIGAKGTIRNKEAFLRSHYDRLEDVDLDHFLGLIDRWVLDYVEQYAADV